MADALDQISWLNKLANRILRGVYPGNSNSPGSGLLYLETDRFSDGNPIQDILVQPEANANNIAKVTGVTFTNGSATVKKATGFGSSVVVGDSVRQFGVCGPFSKVVQVNSDSVTAEESFTSQDGVTSWSGDLEVQKLEFGRIQVYTYLTPVSGSPSFEYEDGKAKWVTTANTQVKCGPFTITTSASLIQTGVSLVGIPGEDAADMNILGVLEKDLPVASQDMPSVMVTPVPNPSVLSEPPVTTRFGLQAMWPDSSSYTFLKYGKDYLLSFTNNPLYDGYRPLPNEAKVANIHLLKNFSASVKVPDGEGSIPFGGLVSIKDGETNLANLSKTLTSITVSDTALQENKDYLLNEQAGVLMLFNKVENENLVSAILCKVSKTYSGVEVKYIDKEISMVSEKDFENASYLEEGVDYTLNSTNGGLALLKAVPPTSTLQVRYAVQGSWNTQTILIEEVSDLRLDCFPVVPNTTSISGRKKGQAEYISLVEGVDFEIFHSNGIVRLLPPAVGVYEELSANYSPAVDIRGYIQVKSPTEFFITMKEVPVATKGDNTMLLFLAHGEESISLTSVKNSDGKSIPIEGAQKTDKNGTWLLQKSDRRSYLDGYVLVDYTYTGNALPFYPVIKFPKSLLSGTCEMPLEGVTLGNEIMEGSLLKVSQEGVTDIVQVTAIKNLDGLNSLVTFSPPLSHSYNNPSLLRTDSVVDFSEGVPVSIDYGEGTSEINIPRSAPVLRGAIAKIKGTQEFLSVITNIVDSGSRLTITLSPSLPSSGTASVIHFSKGAIYAEGDRTLLPSSKMLGAPIPVVQINPPLIVTEPLRFDIQNDTLSLTVEKKTNSGSTSKTFTYADYTDCAKLFSAVNSFVGGDLTHYVDLSGISPSSLSLIPEGINKKQLPYTFLANPSLAKVTSKKVTLAMGSGVGDKDFVVEAGTFVLTKGLQKGDRLIASYGCSNAKVCGGATLAILGQRFIPVPKGTSLRVKMDFDMADQHFIKAQSEKDFLDGYILPYFKEMKEALKGPKTTGYRGVEAAPKSTGGVRTNFVIMRDYWLSAKLLWKISDYYKNRMRLFSEELSPLIGFSVGNNDFSKMDRMSTWGDVCHNAYFGESVFYPKGYIETLPIRDGRFFDYHAFDRVTCYNTGSRGYIYGEESYFNRAARPIAPGDTLFLQGRQNGYTVEELVSDTEIKLTGEIEGAPSAKPTWSRKSGIPYMVVPKEMGAIRFSDDKGCTGAVLVCPSSSSGYTVNKDHNSFVVKISEDAGATWSDPTTFSIPEGEYTEEDIALQLSTLLKNSGFCVMVEEDYRWPNLISEIDKSLEIKWPLVSPSLKNIQSRRNALVLRGFDPYKSILIDASSKVTFGFPVNTIARGAFSPNCVSLSVEERKAREAEKVYLEGKLADKDKLLSWVNDLTTWHTELKKSKEKVKKFQELLISARKSSQSLVTETVGNAATTKSQAEAALTEYQSRGTAASLRITSDEAKETDLSSELKSALAVDLSKETAKYSDIRIESKTSYSTNTGATVTLKAGDTSPYDKRVLMGDGTLTATSPMGKNASDIKVFPAYIQDSEFFGEYTDTVLGTWSGAKEGISPSNTVKLTMADAIKVTAGSKKVTIQPAEKQITITVEGSASITTLYEDYPVLGKLAEQLNKIPGVSITVVNSSYDGSTYGRLQECDVPIIVAATQQINIPFGVRGNISFYSVSYKSYITRVQTLTADIETLGGYPSWFIERGKQLKKQFGPEGESLPMNQHDWLSKLLQRSYGPANLVLSLKRNLIEAMS